MAEFIQSPSERLVSNKKKSRIADNPSAKELADALFLPRFLLATTGPLRRFGVDNEKLEKVRRAAAAVVSQSEILTLPDRFNEAFSVRGWIATGSMPVDTMKRALDLHEAGRPQEAEEEILGWFDEETISLFAINRAKRFNKARKRWDQLREAQALTREARYWSAVPLILIACDGFASDVLGVSPFKKGADLSVFDSIVGHTTSLPFLIQEVTKGVRRSSDEELSLPLRHGILHGQSLGYANRTVCMKAWLLMIALVDWACDKVDEGERQREHLEESRVGLRELAGRLQKNLEVRDAIDAFEPWEKSGPLEEPQDEESPQYAILEFLEFWRLRNFGRMAGRAADFLARPTGTRAGQLRSVCDLVELEEFTLVSVRQTTVVRAEAVALLKGRTVAGGVEGRFRVAAMRLGSDGDLALPGSRGRWVVPEKCVFDLLHGRTLEKEDAREGDGLKGEEAEGVGTGATRRWPEERAGSARQRWC